MMMSTPSRFSATVLSITLIAIFFGCSTAPEEEPAGEPGIEDPMDQESELLSQADIKAAQDAVQRANLIGANRYFPSEYRRLMDDLDTAVAMEDSEPNSARSALRSIISDADDLYGRTLLTRRGEYEESYHRSDDALKAIEADQFAPEEYVAIRGSNAAVLALFENGEFTGAQAKADENLEAQARLHYNLSENIRYVGILRRDTENYLSDAEDNEAFIYAADELDAANEYYFLGISEYRNYDIEASATTLAEAKRRAVLAARTSAVRKKQSETDALMSETRRRLESASNLRTLTPQGTVSDPRPWEGGSYLADNPPVDYSGNVDEVEMDDPQLRRLDEPFESQSDEGPVDVPIEDEGAQVNADEQDADYLALAQSFWEKGVTARNAGRFDLADDYFRQAQAYIDVHESNAVSRTYTVVYRQIATDSLWRIAERPEIFANPFLWPKIWRANRRIIQNPDLIYPGQILTIPPK